MALRLRGTAPFLAGGLVLALAACSTAAAPPTGEESGIAFTDITAPGVAGLDELVWNLPYGEPATVDPAFSSGESPSTVIANMCESLLLQNPDFSLTPNLAAVEEVDDTTYVITIDERATFWDGSPVSPEDVIFSINRTRAPETGSTWAGVLSSIATIEKTGDREVTITLTQPDTFFYPHLATPAGAIVQQAFVEANAETFGGADTGVMCTGPFAFSEWALGEYILMEKNAAYWDTERAALSEALKITFNTDAASVTTAMQNGDINGSFNFPVSAIDALAAGGGSVTLGTSLGLYGIMFVNVNEGPMADPRLREALKLAIDYEGIREGIFADAAQINKTFTPRSAWGYSTEIFEQAWDETEAGVTDLDRARALVEEAGPLERPAVLSYYADLPEDAQVAAAVQAAAAEIGLEIEVNAQTAAENFAMYFEADARIGTDMMIWGGWLDTQEPAAYYQYYTTNGIFNVAGFSNAEFDRVVADSRRVLEDDDRARLITTAQEIFGSNTINIPIVSQYTRLYMSEGITGAVASQAFLYAPWAAAIGTVDAQ
jgi:peptide/nickel transport system substrate-binding protein